MLDRSGAEQRLKPESPPTLDLGPLRPAGGGCPVSSSCLWGPGSDSGALGSRAPPRPRPPQPTPGAAGAGSVSAGPASGRYGAADTAGAGLAGTGAEPPGGRPGDRKAGWPSALPRLPPCQRALLLERTPGTRCLAARLPRLAAAPGTAGASAPTLCAGAAGCLEAPSPAVAPRLPHHRGG